MTWPQVEAYLEPFARSDPAARVCRATWLRRVAGHRYDLCGGYRAPAQRQTAQAILAPSVSLGMAQFNLGFPGTLSLRPSTLQALLIDYISSLELMGFTHIYVLNGHGGNVAPARCAFAEKYAARSFGRETGGPLYCRLVNWWDPPAVNRLRRDALRRRGRLSCDAKRGRHHHGVPSGSRAA